MNEHDDVQRERSIEQATSAWRPRNRDGAILEHPSWADLSEDDRDAVYRATQTLRRMEAALDLRGQSATVRAVLERMRR